MNLKYYVSPYDLFEDGTGAPVILHESNGRSLVKATAGYSAMWRKWCISTWDNLYSLLCFFRQLTLFFVSCLVLQFLDLWV